MIKRVMQGLHTGMILQFAIGPVFLFVLNTSIASGWTAGFGASLGVTTADFVYIALSILGAGKLFEKSEIKEKLKVLSAVILVIFGITLMYEGVVYRQVLTTVVSNNFVSGFIKAFFLTLSSPLTILFWTSIFTAKTIELSLTKKELLAFGLGAGTATIVFLTVIVAIVSFVKGAVPILIIQILNITIGAVIFIYGILRIKAGKSKEGIKENE